MSQPQRTLVLPIVALTKVIIFSRWKKNTGMRLSVKYLLPCSANLSDNIQQTMFVMFFFVIIFMLLSGLLTPISSMPEWAQKFTIVLPPRYYIDIMRAVYLKGTTFVELWHNFAALGIFVILFNTLAAITYKKQA